MINHNNVVTTPTQKVSVRITLREMWRNYMEFQTDVGWDNNGYFDEKLDEFGYESRILCNFGNINYDEDVKKLRKMFKEGYTVVLLGEYMEFLDKPNILREVIVVDAAHDNDEIIISHEDINF